VYVAYCFFVLLRQEANVILEALSEIPSFSKFVLTIDMQLDLTDCEEDVFFSIPGILIKFLLCVC
jgi:hypothetical protein